MPVTRTLSGTINMDVLSRESAEAGVDSAITMEGQQVTWLDTDDTAAVDAAIAAYNAAMVERDQIIAALAANNTFLAIASPTTAQAVNQTKALTRQMNGLVGILHRRGLLD